MGTTFKCICTKGLGMAVLLLAVLHTSAQTIYVKPNGKGDGSSWKEAYGHFSTALENARPGTQIWVAAGKYNPTTGAGRDISFSIPSGVKIYGGFEGSEKAVDERQPNIYASILSGDIGQPGTADNSYNVVHFENADGNTLLDGFTITGGNANGHGNDNMENSRGGGIYNNGRAGASSPVIRNCYFIKNFGRDGGAVYNDGAGGQCHPVFENCVFTENEAGLDGGAVFNDSRNGGQCNPVFRSCIFKNNMATYGGAICHATDDMACELTLEKCSFTENAAYLRGGAIFSMGGKENCFVETGGSVFKGNFPDNENRAFMNAEARGAAYQIRK